MTTPSSPDDVAAVPVDADGVPLAVPAPGERRRVERRVSQRLGDMTIPELRRILLTSLLAALVIAAFVWMVKPVLIAGILGTVIAAYLRPVYLRIRRAIPSPLGAAFATLGMVLLPVIGALVYSYVEILDVLQYFSAHQDEVADRITASFRRFVFLENVQPTSVRRWVVKAAGLGASLPGKVTEEVLEFSISATIFVFTSFYIFTNGHEVVAWVRSKVPVRYGELAGALERNVSGVLYGAIYATLVTQSLKSAIVFVMCLAFRVPLAGALAVVSFIIGFFPIVGSWSVYVPVAAWLLIFRDRPLAAIAVLVVGFLLNTVFISTYLRPKLASERSRVLNFYWMFVGLVTGVYTFGLAGILLGPILIGLLKAVIDTVTVTANWRLVESEADDDGIPDGEASVAGSLPP